VHTKQDNIEAGLPEHKSYKELYSEKWDKYGTRNIPLPQVTPYDGNVELRNVYLNSFQKGVDVSIKNKGEINILCFFPTNQSEHAYADGFNAGRFAVQSNIVELIQKEIQADREAWRNATINYLKNHNITGPQP
jgi:hypothetical protein